MFRHFLTCIKELRPLTTQKFGSILQNHENFQVAKG